MALLYFCRVKPEEHVIDFEKSIGPWLGRTVKMVEYHLHEALQKSGFDLTKEQMVVLKTLYEEDGLNQNELACLIYRDKSSLARLLSKMENKKFIERKPSIVDKRVNQVFITPYGRNTFERVKPLMLKLIQRMEHAISETEKQQIITILKKVQTNLS